MKLSKSTKYWLANGGLGLAVLLVIRYIKEATHQPSDGSRRTYYLVMGVVLLVVLGIVSVFRAYYRRDRDTVVDESLLGSELAVQGVIAADKYKSITVPLEVTAAELHALAETGELTVSADRFSGPVRTDDTIRLQQGKGSYQQSAYGVLDTIDGVNRQVLIKHQARPPIDRRADS